ncbi:MAG: serine hydrolase domain-containing protein [Erythrobacter sp.]
MHRFAAMIALILASTLHASGPATSMDAFIAEEMLSAGVPGLAYGVTVEGEISGDQLGVLRSDEEAAVAPSTPFLIGSVSKSFTALGVMQLVEAGDAELDAPIGRYLDVYAGRPQSAITVRQLLSHTSGYSMLQGNMSQNDLTMDAASLSRRVANIAAMTPVSQPGETWEYSNANYQVLGRLIEVLSGQDYAAYTADNILSPIGMNDSFVHGPDNTDGMATGHRPWFWTKAPSNEVFTGRGSGPQGGIVASARDMARYLSVMMNGEDDVLSAAGKAQMMQPANDASPFYGLGWFVNTQDGTVYHSGSNPGYEALATMIPAEKKGVAVLTNAGSGIGFGGTIGLRNGITARALGRDYNGEASPLPQQATFVMLAALPILFVIAMIWAWAKRAAIRAKTGWSGRFSLWFPLVTTVGLAMAVFLIVPQAFGAPLHTIRLFVPDMGLAMIAGAVTGVTWAVWRLIIAYTGSTKAS